MPTITDWLMVVITAVYVIATIFICSANIKSANASKKQLEEMQRQYEESNRPYIEVEPFLEKRVFFGLRFVNHGNYTANHVRITLNSDFIDSLTEPKFADGLRKQQDKECVIGVGQHYDLFFGTTAYLRNPNKVSVRGIICYQGNMRSFENAFVIDLENRATIFTVNSEHDDLMEKLKKTNDNLENIADRMEEIAEILAEEKNDA